MKSSGEVNERNCVTVARPVTQVAAVLVRPQVEVTLEEDFTSIKRFGRRSFRKFSIRMVCRI